MTSASLTATTVPSCASRTSALVMDAQAGSLAAREALLIGDLPRLKRWAHGRLAPRLRGHMDTGDLAQDVALRTIANLARFTPRHEGSMRKFLQCVATNQLHDGYRLTKRRPEPVELEDNLPCREPGPLELTLDRERHHRYQQALTRLRPKDRRLIVARFVEEMSLADIARAFGLPSSAAARMAVTRAEERLRRSLTTRPAGRSRRG